VLQGLTFWLAIANNIFSICGLAGVLNAQRELVIAFFAFNATQMVALFHFFVDLLADARELWGGVRGGWGGGRGGVDGEEWWWRRGRGGGEVEGGLP
jgi:hypothetical protein